MDFGITFKGDISPKRTVALCKQAEVAGFKYGWFFDSHVLVARMLSEHGAVYGTHRRDDLRTAGDQPRCTRMVGSRKHVRHAGAAERQSHRNWHRARR